MSTKADIVIVISFLVIQIMYDFLQESPREDEILELWYLIG